ncbi:ATP-dependent DNA helicase PIF1-like protein [Tanacetum coccineum]
MLTNLDNRLLREAHSFDANKSKVEHEKLHSMLNLEQRLIYEQIIESVHNDRGQFCFIHGPGGRENFFIQDHNLKIKIRTNDCACCRLFRIGIASLLLPASRTAHSRFVIPLELMENSTCGDFQQILPVIPNANRPETLTMEKLIIENKISIYGCWLWVMGNYQLKKESKDEPTWIEILKEFLIKSWTSPIEQIIAETYPDFTSRQSDDDYVKERAILTPRIDDADAINENIFKNLGGAPVTYNSVDKICIASTDSVDQHDLYPVEFLNSLNFPRMPPHPMPYA